MLLLLLCIIFLLGWILGFFVFQVTSIAIHVLLVIAVVWLVALLVSGGPKTA
jgi:hypothetical protein